MITLARWTLLVCLFLAGGAVLVAQEGSQPRGGTPAPATEALIDINQASASELERLPGVGARTAERIIEYREKNGGFKKIEELMNVQGIGEKSFLRLKPLISVTPPKTDRGEV